MALPYPLLSPSEPAPAGICPANVRLKPSVGLERKSRQGWRKPVPTTSRGEETTEAPFSSPHPCRALLPRNVLFTWDWLPSATKETLMRGSSLRCPWKQRPRDLCALALKNEESLPCIIHREGKGQLTLQFPPRHPTLGSQLKPQLLFLSLSQGPVNSLRPARWSSTLVPFALGLNLLASWTQHLSSLPRPLLLLGGTPNPCGDGCGKCSPR